MVSMKHVTRSSSSGVTATERNAARRWAGGRGEGCCPQGRAPLHLLEINWRLRFWRKGTFIRIGTPSVRQRLCSAAVVSSEWLCPASAVAVTAVPQQRRQSHRCPSGREGPTCELALLGRPGCRFGTGSLNELCFRCFYYLWLWPCSPS